MSLPHSSALPDSPKFTTTDCLNQGHNESSFPGLNVIAIQKFDIPYDELAPALQGHVREESVRRAGNDMLAALKACSSLIEFYAEREMKAPANNQEAVRDTRGRLQQYRDAIALAEGK